MSNIILRAARFAAECHRGQKRKYHGGPYIEHPMRVAGRMAMREGATEDAVAAAWLHDVIEDCGIDPPKLEYHFGEAVMVLVVGLTNPSCGSKAPRAERKRMDREHIAAECWEVKVIKLLDRIDNLSEMGEDDPKFRDLYNRETVLLADAIGRDVAPDLYDELMALARVPAAVG